MRLSLRGTLDALCEHESDKGDDRQKGHETAPHLVSQFRKDGFIVLPSVLDASTVQQLNHRLECVLRGEYDRGQPPDSLPKFLSSWRQAAASTNGGGDDDDGKLANPTAIMLETDIIKHRRVLQVINMHKADTVYRTLATHVDLGMLVAKLAGWSQGARLAQDQVWAKPPGAPPLVFHRDSPYFMFDPPDVVTVWLALDDMPEEVGPLRYVRGSHRWGDCRHVGTARTFFQADGGMALLRSAAQAEGIAPEELDIVSLAGLHAGGISIHNGRTWHGSGKNLSETLPRRGLGLHFVPANVRFTAEARHSKLWKKYLSVPAAITSFSGEQDDNCMPESANQTPQNESVFPPSFVPVPEDDFPVAWMPSESVGRT